MTYDDCDSNTIPRFHNLPSMNKHGSSGDLFTGTAVEDSFAPVAGRVSGLFVPLHFRSRERKVHRDNVRSPGTFVPWNIRFRGAKSPRTFIPWNFCTPGTFAPQERMFQELSFHGTFAPVERSLHKQLLCPLTFAPVELLLPYLKKLWKAGKQCFHKRMLANVRCCLLVGLCVLRSTVLTSPN